MLIDNIHFPAVAVAQLRADNVISSAQYRSMMGMLRADNDQPVRRFLDRFYAVKEVDSPPWADWYSIYVSADRLMTRKEYDVIREEIEALCHMGQDHGYTGHGCWLLSMADRIFRGEEVILSASDNGGYNLCGLEEFITWED